MKKLFTLIAAALMAVGASAQEETVLWENAEGETLAWDQHAVVDASASSAIAEGDQIIVTVKEKTTADAWPQVVIRDASWGEVSGGQIGLWDVTTFPYEGVVNVSASMASSINGGFFLTGCAAVITKMVLKKGKPYTWTNVVNNGDCEGVPGDVEGLIGKDGAGEFKDIMRTNIVDKVGVDGSRAIVVVSSSEATQNYTTQFFITSTHVWKKGEGYKLKLWAKADAAAKITSQSHTEPGTYKDYNSLGDFDLTTEWKEYTHEGTIAVDGVQSICFNLNDDKTLGTTFYFDNVEWYTNSEEISDLTPWAPGKEETSTTLIDYPTKEAKAENGITLGSEVSVGTFKIHTNTDAVSGFKFGGGYTDGGVIKAATTAVLSVDGGFKKGDKIQIAGAFNNSSDSKQAGVQIFTGAAGESATVLWTSELFINGRLVADDPAVQEYTLEADAATLNLGRSNGLSSPTATWVTLLKVVRETATGIQEIPVKVINNGAIYNLAGQRVNENYKGIVIKNGKKYFQK